MSTGGGGVELLKSRELVFLNVRQRVAVSRETHVDRPDAVACACACLPSNAMMEAGRAPAGGGVVEGVVTIKVEKEGLSERSDGRGQTM
jgi:hypothetical protein